MTPLPIFGDAYLSAQYDVATTLEQDMRRRLGDIHKNNYHRLSELREMLKRFPRGIPSTVPEFSMQGLSLVIFCSELSVPLTADEIPASEYFKRSLALINDVTRYCRRVAQVIRTASLWQAVALRESRAISARQDTPRYLLRAQIKSIDAKCSFNPDLGLLSARQCYVKSADLSRFSHAYQQHLRRHCNGDYGEGETDWISCTESATWLADKRSNYRWEKTGHQIAFINTEALAAQDIPFARSSDLVVEADLEQWRAYHNRLGSCPANVVKFATDSHWLVYGWVPAQCITWVLLEDFVRAVDEIRTLGAFRADHVDAAVVLEYLQTDPNLVASRLTAEAVTATIDTTESTTLHIDQAMEAMTISKEPRLVSRSEHKACQTEDPPEELPCVSRATQTSLLDGAIPGSRDQHDDHQSMKGKRKYLRGKPFCKLRNGKWAGISLPKVMPPRATTPEPETSTRTKSSTVSMEPISGDFHLCKSGSKYWSKSMPAASDPSQERPPKAAMEPISSHFDLFKSGSKYWSEAAAPSSSDGHSFAERYPDLHAMSQKYREQEILDPVSAKFDLHRKGSVYWTESRKSAEEIRAAGERLSAFKSTVPEVSEHQIRFGDKMPFTFNPDSYLSTRASPARSDPIRDVRPGAPSSTVGPSESPGERVPQPAKKELSLDEIMAELMKMNGS